MEHEHKIITKEEATKLIKNSKGFFTVQFKKRSDGQIRVMNARFGVEKYLKGGDPAYNFEEKNLIPVWDTTKKEYRSIPIEGIIRLSMDGKKYEIQEERNK